MEKEFQEIIQKNLPAQVGEALKIRLIIADNAEKLIPELKNRIEQLEGTVLSQESKIISQNEIDAKLQLLKTQEEKLTTERRDLEVEKLKIQLEAEKEKSEFSKGVAMGLVRNIEFRRNVFNSKSGPDSTDQYGNQLYATHTVNATETKEAE